LNNFPVIKENIATFIQVAARKLARRRDADQLGTLVAGAWALTSRAIATDEEAAHFLDGFQWPEFRDESLHSEGYTVLQTITRQRLRDLNNREVVVAELIAMAAGKGILDRSAEEADHLLQSHGLRVMQRDSGKLLLVATNHDAVRALAKGSGFESDLWRQLARIKGARLSKQGEKFEKERFAGNPCRYVELPIACALGEDWESEFISTDPAKVAGEQLFVNRHPRASQLQ
jgi:putative DNA primase/helicase